MVTDKVNVETAKYAVTVKINAKREVYGDYAVRADTFEELQSELARVGALFMQHIR